MPQIKYLKNLGIVLLTTLLISCTTSPIQKAKNVFLSAEIPIVAHPHPLDLHSDIKLDVVVNENIEEYISEIEVGGQYVFYGISVRDYEKLSINISELKRYIEQQKEIIKYYEKSVK